MARELPTGTVTFLFTDVVGSTKLLVELGSVRYAELLGEHRRVIREASGRYGGVEMGTAGDACFLAFPAATGALEAAAEIVDELTTGPIRVRIGLHTGTPLVTDGDYVGDDVHLVARIAAAGHGGQVLVSGATVCLLGSTDIPQGVGELCDLGEHRFKDITGAVTIFQLGDLSFPPLRSLSNSNVPRPVGSFIGRERELAAVLARLSDGVRLLTLTGPGGTGKTRLAIEAAASALADHTAGVYWVPLDALRDPALVPGAIAQSIGARDGVAEHIGERDLLLVVDNFEQVIEAASVLSGLLAACPNLVLLVTSRERLGVRGEVAFALPPLVDSDAVALFCDRAGVEPSEVIAELCRRVDALPLAVELAAARATVLTPSQILDRLSGRLDLLAGSRDADPRHRTLRATMEWSYELLDGAERRLLRRLSVFAGGCTLHAAEAVTGTDLDTLQSLVDKSLVRFADGRFWMLDTVREFAAERLDTLELDATRRRHRSYVVGLTEASAPSLHTADEAAASEGLAADYPNVRAAVVNALDAGEPDDVGRILGALYPFLITRGNLAEVGEWVDAALDMRDRLSAPGLAETLAGGGEIARFAGDFARAIELKEEELASGVDDVKRPNWRAATLADLCEIALDQGDFANARRYAERSEAAGSGARARLCFAELTLRLGDLADAQSHGVAALDGLPAGSYNHACALELLGEVARRGGEAVRARNFFRDGLQSFVALDDGGGIADCLDGLARVAVVDGDVSRAGRLHGAAQHLRESRGRRPIRADVPLPAVDPVGDAEGRSMMFDAVIDLARCD